MLQAGKLPGLQSILDAGGVFCDIETINKTVTVPTWTLMFTSLDSSQTGVTTNRNTRQKIPIEDIITNPIRNSGYLIGWFVAKDFLWNNSPLKKIMSNVDAGGLFTAVDNAGACLDNSVTDINQRAVQFIMDNRGKDFFLFVHIGPDCYGHGHGENSERYLYEFVRSDEVVQNILAVIDFDTRIMVVNDHGFDEGASDHQSAPDLWMVTDLLIKEIYHNGETRGTVRDIPLTIWDFFGVYGWRDNPSKYRGKSMLIIE
ncbi:MAG: hypothetical protein A2Y98_02395 [Candidatus Portnoybacteria bacterium RBG_19FT_COMBO_36_7]|uniref:Metalloenzyme domain-containing protein n=1 Tax=Candidatus Portnoybacteria bacterium RBG_19FT_COMBO_36_7 TaxID=1801992 RepID=A0A1G2F961_9BACT|nr:MAG: hypothetical protein A2Y98_02395 [Candidatus Portnoybacteria bacterium RBG_19FT_COMBO_36_7]